jgi:DNA segregation ATPase FtsK/SpoIIIE, S-DNA-T family
MSDQPEGDRPNAEIAVPDPIVAVPAEVSDVSYEVELDHAPAGAAVYVDVSPAAGERLPVIPPHLRTPAGMRTALARQVQVTGHRGAYHSIRSPRYLLLAVAWAIVGVFRVLARQLRWWWVLESHGLRSQAAADGDSREWHKLDKDAREVRKVRGMALGGELAAVIAVVVVLVKFAPWWVTTAAAAVALPLLAIAGRPADKRIITPAVVTPRFRRLNADVVLRAYYAAKLGDPDKPGQQITFAGRMSRDGAGSGVLVDLPYGKGLRDAVEAKEAIASGLDVTDSQVFIRRDPTSIRRHGLWVADEDPLRVPVGRTPLLACRQTDVWQPCPLGLDERGQLATLDLLWHSILVGALPRQGKSFVARLLGLYAALDPFCKLDVFDASGKPDWRRFALVADSFAFGLTPTAAGLPPEILLDTLERLKSDVNDRYERLSALQEANPAACPEGKLTRELARDRQFGMPVRLLILDEVQEYFDLGPISAEIATLLVFLTKVAPGAGVTVIPATQRPSGIGTGRVAQQFLAMRDTCPVRFALRTSDYRVSEMVLGAGSLGEGLDASKLLSEYKGVGILRGASDKSPTIRTYLADGTDAERILTAARSIRERAGTLSGMALAADAPRVTVSVAADVLAVLGDMPGAHWEVLAGLLRGRFPDRHGDATADSVSAQCRAAGIPSVNVTMLGKALKGCRKSDVQSAARQP